MNKKIKAIINVIAIVIVVIIIVAKLTNIFIVTDYNYI